MNPEISVLLCVYNTPLHYFKNSVESVLNQTFSNWELICINDGSSLNLTKCYKRYISNLNDKRIKYYKHKNIGLTKSLNIGIKLCKGQYIARLDSDDTCEKNRFQEQLNFFKKNPDCKILSSFYNTIDEKGSLIKKTGKKIDCDLLNSVMLIDNYLCHSTMMISKKLLLESDCYNENFKVAQDYDLWLKLLRKEKKIEILPLFLVNLRIHKASISSTTRNLQKQAADSIRKNHIDKLFEINNNRCYELLSSALLFKPDDTVLKSKWKYYYNRSSESKKDLIYFFINSYIEKNNKLKNFFYKHNIIIFYDNFLMKNILRDLFNKKKDLNEKNYIDHLIISRIIKYQLKSNYLDINYTFKKWCNSNFTEVPIFKKNFYEHFKTKKSDLLINIILTTSILIDLNDKNKIINNHLYFWEKIIKKLNKKILPLPIIITNKLIKQIFSSKKISFATKLHIIIILIKHNWKITLKSLLNYFSNLIF
jgi:glycosyltransferase involved in cell wall biosynthesis